jgi:protease-4
VPNISKLREKAGIDIDVVTTNKHASLTQNAIFQGMTAQEYQLMQTMVERGYDLFTNRCAEGRGMTQDAIKAIGEGRVWLGVDAVQIGLVDELGNIQDAVAKAAELAELGEYAIASYPEKKDPIQQLLEMLDKTSPEERLALRIREFASQPRIMAIMPEVTIQ